MDSRSEPPEVVARHQGKAWPTVLKIGLGLLLVLLVAAIALSTLSAPQPVVWLDPAKVVLAPKPPGAIAQLRRKLAILTAPVWQRFRRARPQIMIDSSVMKLSSAAAEGAALGAPTATNTDGLKAWVVSPEQLAALRQRLKNAPGATPLT